MVAADPFVDLVRPPAQGQPRRHLGGEQIGGGRRSPEMLRQRGEKAGGILALVAGDADPLHGQVIQRLVRLRETHGFRRHIGVQLLEHKEGVHRVVGSQRGAVRPAQIRQQAELHRQCIHRDRLRTAVGLGAIGGGASAGTVAHILPEGDPIPRVIHDQRARRDLHRAQDGVAIRQGGEFFQNHRLGFVVVEIERAVVNGLPHALRRGGGIPVEEQRDRFPPQADGEHPRGKRGRGGRCRRRRRHTRDGRIFRERRGRNGGLRPRSAAGGQKKGQ